MAAHRSMVVDPSMGVNPGQPDSLMQHSLAMVQNPNRKFFLSCRSKSWLEALVAP